MRSERQRGNTVCSWYGGGRPRSDATTVHGENRTVLFLPVLSIHVQNTCYVLNFAGFGVLKFSFAAVRFLFKAPSSPL